MCSSEFRSSRSLRAKRSSAKTWMRKKQLEAFLLTSLHQKEDCADIAGLSIYDCGSGRWTIGHIRLGPSHKCSEMTLSEVQRQFAKVFLLLPD